jgi:hypothetical protein
MNSSRIIVLQHDFIGAPATQGNSKITAHPALPSENPIRHLARGQPPVAVHILSRSGPFVSLEPLS